MAFHGEETTKEKTQKPNQAETRTLESYFFTSPNFGFGLRRSKTSTIRTRRKIFVSLWKGGQEKEGKNGGPLFCSIENGVVNWTERGE
jgi:hypothetical protein